MEIFSYQCRWKCVMQYRIIYTIFRMDVTEYVNCGLMFDAWVESLIFPATRTHYLSISINNTVPNSKLMASEDRDGVCYQ